MKYIGYIAIQILFFSILVTPLWAISGENTYVFAASACPPWKTKLLEKHAKDIANACKNDVEIFTSNIQKALDVPSENILTLVDEQATYSGLIKALLDFAEKVPKNSRVIMLFNFHGDLSDIAPDGKPIKDEVLVLWTDEKPFTMLSALALKQWITAKELRKMIDKIRADEIVVTVDACHSGGVLPDILKDHGRDNNWRGKEAVLMSSKSSQFSYFNKEGSHGLFTYYLSGSIGSNDFANFHLAYQNAAKETIDYVQDKLFQKKCEKMIWETLHKREACEQTPISYDPSNLLPSIKLKTK